MASHKGKETIGPRQERNALPGNNRGRKVLTSLILAAMLLFGSVAAGRAAEAQQKVFAAPDAAVQALVAAVKANRLEELAAVLGPGRAELLSSGDAVADRRGRQKFLEAYRQGHILQQQSPERMVLVLGSRHWPLPIPLVKKGDGWVFDAQAGKQEILNRRIGRNELRVIEVLQAYVEAQHEYATRDYRGGGMVEFAQKLTSSPGKRDGLYWKAKKGEQESPFGPLMARATQEGYPEADLSPFHGYYFKILKGQGEQAAGGAYSYIVKDRMLLGFALIAYPAEYGNSGIMTFMVNQAGTIYQKDLGAETKQQAAEIALFDPDSSWQRVEEAIGQEGP